VRSSLEKERVREIGPAERGRRKRGRERVSERGERLFSLP
jgi:hypothetical protein